jgi:hypothetical protein
MVKRIVFVILLCLVFASFSNAQNQDAAETANQIEYVNRNQVDPPYISLRKIKGRAIDLSGVAVPKVTVALFTEKEHRFIAQTVTDENGYFQFSKIPKGSFRLVGRVERDFFCPVNTPIRKVSFPQGGLFRSKGLVLHLRPAGIDTCSYSDTK